MHEIFISYSSKRRGLTRKLEKAIEARYGRDSVWCDNKLESWGSFEGHIHAKTEAARAIVVIWNEEAAASDSIKSEAHSAFQQGRLVNVAMDSFPPGKIPMPYSIYQVKLLGDIEGILESIAGVMAGKPLEIAVPEEEERGGGPLPGGAQEDVEAAAFLREDDARDDSGPLTSPVPEQPETAAHLDDAGTGNYNGSLPGAAWEESETVVALAEAGAGVHGGSLAGVAQETFETVPSLYEESVFMYSAPLSDAMWEKPEAVALFGKAGVRGEGELAPRVKEAKPEVGALSEKDAASDDGELFIGPALEKPEAIAPSEENADPDHGPAFACVTEEEPEDAAPLEEDAALDYGRAFPRAVEEEPEAAAPLEENAALDYGRAFPRAVEEEPEDAAPLEEDAALDYGRAFPRAVEQEPEAAAPLEEDAALDYGRAFPRAVEQEPEAAVPLEENAALDYGRAFPRAVEEEPEAAAPLEEDAARDYGRAFLRAVEEEPEAAAPLEEDAAPDYGRAFLRAVEEEPEDAAPLEENAVLDYGGAFPRAVEEEPEATAPLEENAALDYGRAFPRAVEEEPEAAAPLEENAALDYGGAYYSATEEKLEAAAPVEDDDVLDDGDPLLDAKQDNLKSDLREILPSELLQARYAAVPFNDAARAMARCLAWCQDGAKPAAGRLYHGPGGAGKTRLLIEVTAGLREEGWTAGFLNHDFGSDEDQRTQAWQALERRVLRGRDAGVLIVLDHAEARQAEVVKIARLLLQKRANATRPLRLVLLSRSASPWWERLREEHEEIARLFAGTPDALALNPMSSAGARQALFKESAMRFWPVLQAQGFVRPTGAPPRERLERITKGDGFERPLAIQMEALLYLCATPPAAGDGIGRQLDKMLDLELACWEKLLGLLADGSREDLAHGTAQVAAVGGTPSQAATEALLLADEFDEDRRTGDADVGPALYNLACLFGRDDGSVAPIEPDLLGEHHLAATADAELIEGCLAWIGTQPEVEQEARSRHLVATLQRAAGAEHGVKAGKATVVLDGLILHHMPALAADFVAVLTSTPGPLKRRIEVLLGALDFEALRALDLALPKSHPELLEFAHKAASRHATQATAALSKLRSKGADAKRLEFALKDIADALNSVGSRLSALGKHEEALASSLEAARILPAPRQRPLRLPCARSGDEPSRARPNPFEHGAEQGSHGRAGRSTCGDRTLFREDAARFLAARRELDRRLCSGLQLGGREWERRFSGPDRVRDRKGQGQRDREFSGAGSGTGALRAHSDAVREGAGNGQAQRGAAGEVAARDREAGAHFMGGAARPEGGRLNGQAGFSAAM